MANEDFLGCLSKAGIEKVASSLGVLPRPRVKETRAEVIKRAQGGTFVHPAAHFALSEAEATLHLEQPRSYSWENDSDEPLDGDRVEEGDGSSGAGVDDGEDAPEEESESDAIEEDLPASVKARPSRRPQAEAA
jgi:ParB family chromosome partitioning protein